MTVLTSETLQTVAAEIGASAASEPERNADRLASWKRRYPYDVVECPASSQPPQWPIERAQKSSAGNVTKFVKARSSAR